MTKKLFGTDGIRGKANIYPMTAMDVLKIAQSTAHELKKDGYRNKVVIGKDTRLSGYMIEPSLVSGFISMGMDVILVGVMPTPAISMLTKSLRADLGVMISASHNPYYDNGIKLFGSDGYKISDEIEQRIENNVVNNIELPMATEDKMGKAERLDDVSGRYIEYVKNTFSKGQKLDGLKIVLDSANGAAYKLAPRILYELGAEVIPIGCNPDGTNINSRCGATAIDIMRETVVKNHADLGIALDGDADRIIMCDEQGGVIDGDQLIAVIAKYLKQSNRLKDNTVVTTVMSNLGLELFLKENKINLIRTGVGDRYVVSEMKKSGYNLGGEQSGHIILGDYGTTGDGIVAGLQILSVIQKYREKNNNAKVSDICQIFKPLPQILKNIRYKTDVDLQSKMVQKILQTGEDSLGDTGRILVRKSGTEPLIRVMAEGSDNGLVKLVVDKICDDIEELDNSKSSVA